LQKREEEIIIITDRKTKWPFDAEKLSIIDFSNKHRNYFVYHVSTIKDWYKRICYISKIKKDINNIVKHQEYLLYIPNYAVNYQTLLAENKLCKGYYFIEEGTLAYTPYDILLKQWKKRSILQKIKALLGGTNRFYLTTSKSFLGTIQINEHAFMWNRRNKIINDTPSFENLKNYPLYKNIIVTGYLSNNINYYKNCIYKLADFLYKKGIYDAKIKIHPHLYSNYPERIKALEEILLSIPNVLFKILPHDYIVEMSILKNSCSIFSLGEFSSLNIYSLLYGGESYLISEDFIKFDDIQACINYIRAQY